MKKLRKGDILLARNYGLLGLLIRKVTKSKYNHVCMYIGNDILVDTDFFGVRYRRLSAYDNIPHKIIRVKEIDRKMAHKLCKQAKKLVGKRYSVASLFRIRNSVGKTYNCSQMVNAIYSKFGFVLCDDFIRVTPADIERSKLTYVAIREKTRTKIIKEG